MKLPHSLQKVLDITERYFHAHGEIKPTILCFTNDVFTVQEAPIPDLLFERVSIADTMIKAAMQGATAVAIATEAWGSERRDCRPTDDPNRKEWLIVGYEQPECSYSSICQINRQRFGRPRLTKWQTEVRTDSHEQRGVFESLYHKARIRKNTVLTFDAPEPSLMLVLTPNGECLRNSAGHALVASSYLMAQYCIDNYSNGGEFRCVLVLDHLDLVMEGFRMTGTEESYATTGMSRDRVKAQFELVEEQMKAGRE